MGVIRRINPGHLRVIALSLLAGCLAAMSAAVTAPSGYAADSLKFSEPILVDSGVSPQWSPDGSMLAYLSRGGLYVTDTPQFKNPRRIGDSPRGQFQWVGNFGFTWVERPQPKHDTLRWNAAKLYYMNLNGFTELVEADSVHYREHRLPRIGNLLPSFDGTLGYYQLPGKSALQGIPKVLRRQQKQADSLTFLPLRKFAYIDKPVDYRGPDGDIWVCYPDGSGARQITHGPNTWMSPVLCLNEMLVAADNHRGEIVIIDSTGIVKANAGRGGFPTWSPDCRYIVFNVDEETEFEIVGAELYLFDPSSGQRKQLTYTPNIVEGHPMWNPAGKHIVYGTLETSQIFVMIVEEAE